MLFNTLHGVLILVKGKIVTNGPLHTTSANWGAASWAVPEILVAVKLVWKLGRPF